MCRITHACCSCPHSPLAITMTTTTATTPQQHNYHDHDHDPHLHALHHCVPRAGLPCACRFSLFFFLLTSSFVVQSPHSHHPPCRWTCGHPPPLGPTTA